MKLEARGTSNFLMNSVGDSDRSIGIKVLMGENSKKIKLRSSEYNEEGKGHGKPQLSF